MPERTAILHFIGHSTFTPSPVRVVILDITDVHLMVRVVDTATVRFYPHTSYQYYEVEE